MIPRVNHVRWRHSSTCVEGRLRLDEPSSTRAEAEQVKRAAAKRRPEPACLTGGAIHLASECYETDLDELCYESIESYPVGGSLHAARRY